MADLKISELPAVATAAGTDQIPVNQGGTTKKETVFQLASILNPALGTSRIRVISTTSLGLGVGIVPLRVSSLWQARAITSEITISNATLAANTTYFVYVFDSAGVNTLEISTTTHAIDTTFGVEIKSGDATRTLVGMIRTNASSQFQDDVALLGAISWFNRRTKAVRPVFTADRAVTTTSFSEFNTEIRANILTWGDEAVSLSLNGGTQNNASGGISAIGISSVDSTSSAFVTCSFRATAVNDPIFPIGISGHQQGVTEGFHFYTVLGLNAATQTTTMVAAIGGADPGELVAAVRG